MHRNRRRGRRRWSGRRSAGLDHVSPGTSRSRSSTNGAWGASKSEAVNTSAATPASSSATGAPVAVTRTRPLAGARASVICWWPRVEDLRGRESMLGDEASQGFAISKAPA